MRFFTRRSEEPQERLSRIGDAMMDAAKAHREGGEDVKMVVMLEDDEDRAVCAHGYDRDSELIAAILASVEGVFQAHGGRIHVFAMPPSGIDCAGDQ